MSSCQLTCPQLQKAAQKDVPHKSGLRERNQGNLMGMEEGGVALSQACISPEPARVGSVSFLGLGGGLILRTGCQMARHTIR